MTRPNFDVDPILSGELPPEVRAQMTNWPGRVRAAKLIGVKPIELRRMVREGELREYQAPDKSRRYNPEDLEEFAADAADDDESNEMTVGGKPIEGMRAATDLLKQSQGHNERLLDTAIRGFDACTKAMANVIERLSNENAQYARAYWEGIHAVRAAQTQEIEVSTEAAVRMQAEERRTALVQGLLSHAKPIFAALGEAVEKRFPSQEPTSQPSAHQPGQDESVATTVTSAVHSPVGPTVADGDLPSKALELLRRIGPSRLQMAATLIPEEEQPLAAELIDYLKGTES